MSNMSYCRFENTYNDFYDCLDNLGEQLTEREESFARKLRELAEEYIENYDSLIEGE